MEANNSATAVSDRYLLPQSLSLHVKELHDEQHACETRRGGIASQYRRTAEDSFFKIPLPFLQHLIACTLSPRNRSLTVPAVVYACGRETL